MREEGVGLLLLVVVGLIVFLLFVGECIHIDSTREDSCSKKCYPVVYKILDEKCFCAEGKDGFRSVK